jgi:hypothetical protein
MAAVGCDQEGNSWLERWNYLLQPLTDTWPGTTMTKDEDIMSLSKQDNSEQLHAQSIVHQVIWKLQEELESIKVKNAQSKEHQSGLGINPTPKAKLPKIGCQKPDVEKPGSSWSLPMLAKYVEPPRLDGCGSKFEFGKSLFTWVLDDKFKSEIQEVLQTLKVDLDDVPFVEFGETGLKELQNYSLLESSIRMVLDSLLRYVCRETGTILRTQYPMKRETLPNNVFDYVLIDRVSEKFVGVVEAKKPSTMNENAVAQLIMQLFSLVTVDPELTYFGILSDGYRFLLVSVNEYEISFERDNNMVFLNEAKTRNELQTIVAKICRTVSLCRRQKSCEEGCPIL